MDGTAVRERWGVWDACGGACRKGAWEPASTRVSLLPLLKIRWGLSSLDTRGTLWCCSPTWTLDSMLSRDQLIELRNTPNSLNISRSLRKTLFKFNIWNPSFKHTAKVKNHIKTFAHSKCGLLNARSINNKEDSIYELITDNDLDVLALIETWCTDNSDVSLGLVTPPGYAIVQTHRSSRGGGVGVIYRDSLRARLEKCEKYSSFEHQTVNLFSDSDVLRIITVYNPSGNFTTVFYTEFNDLLCHLQTTTGKHLIVGDFNFHVNNQSDSGANKFKALLNQYNLSQHVTIPTHTAGNTLDLVITRSDLLVTGLKSDQSVDLDHFALIFNLSFQSPGAVKRTITCRNWKSVDISILRSDIAKAFDGFTTQDPESAVKSYNFVLKDIVDKHAPEKSRVIVVWADAPWYMWNI